MKHFTLTLCLLALGFAGSAQQRGNDPTLTEIWTPVPPKVTPGEGVQPPSDAIVLFNGANLNEWVDNKGETAQWVVSDGVFTVKPGSGDITSKHAFGDCQLHIEWRCPANATGTGQGLSNSGLFLQSRYEVQILDNFENKTYVNGQAASIYKQTAPLVNACRRAGEWNVYDIIYTAPRFSENGRVAVAARITLLHNGVLVLNNVEIWGSTEYIGLPHYDKHDLKQPLRLQDHGNPISFRNVWIREL